jgi:hypothetical protein
MGLLDDAIREHMELKRLRGADPGEVAREEQDVLGPVDLDQHAESQESEDGSAAAERVASGREVTVEDSDRAGTGESAEHDAGAASEISPEQDFANVGQETAELDMRTVLDEQHEAADRAGQIDSAGLGAVPSGETRERVLRDDPESVEDVLEETPDFLRDTPEQERLWFEQQPPRDFDFDK